VEAVMYVQGLVIGFLSGVIFTYIYAVIKRNK